MTDKRTDRTPNVPGNYSLPSFLRGLRDANEQLLLAQKRVDDAVSILRSPDSEGYCLASWAEVGAALGISKQAAAQRYNRRGL